MTIKTTAVIGGKPVKSPLSKTPSALKVPVYPVKEHEGLTLGLRMDMVSVGGGLVQTGSGLGTDYIILSWGNHHAVLRGSEILRAWVKTFSPEDAKRFPEEVRGV